jgi:alcohol dehydrogenase class IV
MRLVAVYLPKALENPADLEARYFLTYAAMTAGIAFDNGLLHFTHALEHPLSGIKPEVTHGLGLSILLPAVVKEIYPACGAILADILSPMAPGLGDCPECAQKAADGVRAWLHSVGITETLKDLGFTEADVPKLVRLAFETPGLEGLINNAPVPHGRDVVERIYRSSL